MIAFLFVEQNLPFSVALFVVLIIGLIEAFGLFAGFSLSQILPIETPDSSVDMHLEHATALDKALSWLRIGKVPLSILLILFLTSFGLIGFGLQSTLFRITGWLLPGSIASALAILMALPCVRIGADLFARLMPADETSAVSSASFVGRVATITTGSASYQHAAQGKLKDQFQQTHYIMLEPDNPSDVFPPGSSVLLVRQSGALFYAIAVEHSSLIENNDSIH